MNKAENLITHDLLINGKWVPATGGGTFNVINPYTQEISGVSAAATVEDAIAAADAAAAAFQTWKKSSPGQRRELINKAADLMTERAPEIAKTISSETGSTFGWGMFNVMLATNMLREAAAQTYSVKGEVIPSDLPGAFAMGVRQPCGVVVGIAPWNAPLILGVRSVAFPLAYGNTVVLKSSVKSPGVHMHIAKVLQDAGLPDGVVNFISNDSKDAAAVVEALIAHQKVRRINFTGSSHVGRIIAETAGRHLKRVLLELGGKAPMVVLGDADLDEAVAAAAFGAFMHQGQICMSTERLVVEKSVVDEFAEKFAAKAASLKVGDPNDETTQIGCMIDLQSAQRVKALIDDAVSKGAEILTGGKLDGATLHPTVLKGVTKDMKLYYEESFGPVAPIIVAEDMEDAIRIANDTEYGLSSAVFTRDFSKALKVSEELETGMVHINDATVHDEAQMPFGGVKDSGWGRFGSGAALDEFTEMRWITYQREPRHYPI